MRRFSVLALVAVAACSSKTPPEAAALYDMQATDGFKNRGAVAISDQHVLTTLDLVPEGVKTATVIDGKGTGYGSIVLRRGKDVGMAVLFTEDHSVPHAKIGCSGELQPGMAMAMQYLNKDGKATVLEGSFIDWRYSEGFVYLETDIEAPKDAAGAGYFGPEGTLVGVQSFKLAPKLTYVMPIEYIANGRGALTETMIGSRDDCPVFAEKRAEAENHPDPLPTPLKFGDIAYQQEFSKTALVGALTILQKKDSPILSQAVKWKLESVDAEENVNVIGEGDIAKGDVKWASSPDLIAETKGNLVKAFGEAWVAEHFDPYDYGYLRYRIPFAPFCPKVKDTEVHNLTITLGDGRGSGKIGFSDMVNICSASEGDEGAALEKEWGLGGGATAPAPAPAAAKSSKKKKKKKKKRKR